MSSPFPYSLVAIDLDGTLFTSEKIITENTISVLRKLHFDHGVKIVLASGRMTENMSPLYVNVLKMTDEVFMIGYNGAKCLQMTTAHETEQLFHMPLPSVLYSDLFEYCSRNELLLTMYVNGRCIAVVDKDDGEATEENNKKEDSSSSKKDQFMSTLSVFADITSNHKWEYVSSYHELLENKTEITNGLIITENEAHADHILSDLRKLFPSSDTVHLVKTECATHDHHQFYVEILHPLANKGLAIQTLCNQLNIAHDKVVVFGDGENDVEMFKHFDGICVANACASLKKIAKRVSPYTNNEESIYRELTRLLSVEDAANS